MDVTTEISWSFYASAALVAFVLIPFTLVKNVEEDNARKLYELYRTLRRTVKQMELDHATDIFLLYSQEYQGLLAEMIGTAMELMSLDPSYIPKLAGAYQYMESLDPK
jgi:hypothetical protein